MKAAKICTKAGELVRGDRAALHGDKAINLQNIAHIWNAILVAKTVRDGHRGLNALDVANMLEALKIARRYAGSHNIDDYIDGAGYAGCAGEIASTLSTSPVKP
jgi:hypothetical protein